MPALFMACKTHILAKIGGAGIDAKYHLNNLCFPPNLGNGKPIGGTT
jgi:hypothetical protein